MTDANTLMTDRRLPWHDASTSIVDSAQTAEQALVAAGLNWDVTLKTNRYDVYQDGKTIRRKSRAMSVVRTDTMDEIGVVGSKYRTLSNVQSFSFLDNLAQNTGATFVNAGTQRGGSRVFIVMKLPETVKVLGHDEHDQYVLFVTSHDGSLAVTATPTLVRITCTNMFRSLLGSVNGERKVWRAQHLSNLESRLEDAAAVRKSMDLVIDGQSRFQRLVEHLVFVPVNGDLGSHGFYELMDKAMPWSGSARDKIVEAIREIWSTSDTIDPEWRDTAWGLLNATTEYMDHYRRYRGSESRFNNIMFTLGATVERNLTQGLSRISV